MAKSDPKDEEVKMTRGELEAMLASRDKAAKRTPEETAMRAAFREEIDSALDEKLTSFFDLDSGGENDGGDADSGFWGQMGKLFGSGEPAK